MAAKENRAVIRTFIAKVINQGQLERTDDLAAVDIVEIDVLSGQQQRRDSWADHSSWHLNSGEFEMFDGSRRLLTTRLINGGLVMALFCSSLNGCSRGDIMEAISISSAIAGAAAVIAIVAVHQATERQRRAAREQAGFAQQMIEQHGTRGLKSSRYIAVATLREPDSEGAKSLMIFDTQTEQVVGNRVYDVKTEPKAGQFCKFETYSAEYVGTGRYYPTL
jgi:type II secretory pathway pseudopilin PulG